MLPALETVHRGLGYVLWRILLVAVVLLAIYVAGTRALLRAAPLYQDAVVRWVSEETGLDFQLRSLSGDVTNFKPKIGMSGLQILLPEGFAFSFDSASATIDPWSSLLALQLRLDTLRLSGISADIPFGLAEAGTSHDNALNRSRLAAGLLAAFRTVTVEEAEIWLDNGAGARERLTLSLELRRSGSERKAKLSVKGPSDAALTVSGSGIGDILQPLRFGGDLHGHLRMPDAAWLSSLLGKELGAQVDIDFWYHSDNQMPQVVVAAELANVSWSLKDGHEAQLDELAFVGEFLTDNQGWTTRLQSGLASVGEADFSLDRLQIDGGDGGLSLQSTEIDVGRLGRVVAAAGLLPAEVSRVVTELDPSGLVLAVQGRVANWADPLESWSLTAQAQDISISPRKNIPGLLGMDGTVVASEAGATAWIETRDFTLDLPRVYRAPIELETVRGRLSARWDGGVLRLYDGMLQAGHETHDANVLFGIDVPLTPAQKTASPLTMYLDVGVPAASIATRQHYVPYKIPPALSAWLDSALGTGQLSDTSFLWRGEFKAFGSGRQSMQLAGKVVDAEVRFQPNWPPVTDLTGTLLIDTDQISVWGDTGMISGMVVRDVSVEVDAAPDSGLLMVGGHFEGEGGSALGLLRESPIHELASGVLDDLQLTGSAEGHLDLQLNFRSPQSNLAVAVATELSDASVSSSVLSLTLDEVSGGLDFDLRDGFVSRDLKGMLFNQPLVAAIGRGESSLQSSNLFEARFSSRVSGDSLIDWGHALAGSKVGKGKSIEPLSGDTALQVAISVVDGAQVEVTSTLEGLAIELPAPLGKAAANPAPLTVRLGTGPSEPWDIFWSGRGQGRLFRAEAAISGIAVDVTPSLVPSRLPLVGDDGIRLFGELQRIELDPWLRVIQALELGGEREPGAWPLRVETLGITEVVVGTFAIEDVTVDVTPYPGWYQLGLNTAWLDAELTIPNDDRDIALIINAFDYDQLSGLNTVATDDYPDGSERLARRPPQLPVPVDVTVANLTYRGNALGAARFRLQSASDALVIDDLRGQLAGLEFLEGSGLTWSEQGADDWSTRLYLNAGIGDLERTFKELSIAPLARTRSGDLTANLAWPGGPTDINLLELSGSSRLTLQEGSFLPVSPGATGAVRIFSLLNLAGLFGRADVTRIFDPGVTFRAAEGDFLFTPGGIEIPRFDILGTGGGFNFSSDIDLMAETIEGELVVTLPLVENIPWMAALVGGLPVAAGAYLVSKVFERQMMSLSSGVYAVQGDLNNPEVRFIRIFDAGSDASQRPASNPDSGVSEDAQELVPEAS